MNSDTLKPCPFCGTEPTIIEELDDSITYIACRNDDCKVIVETLNAESLEESIAIWNKRMYLQ